MNPSLDTTLPSPPLSFIGQFRSVQSRLHDLPCISSADYIIADVPLRLCFGSEALRAKIAPAFAHLRVEDSAPPSLTIFIHEHASIFPVTLFGSEAVRSSGESDIWTDDSDELSLIVQRRGSEISAIDWQRRNAYWLVPYASSMAYIERARPLHQILLRWLGRQKRFFVHGAAVGNERGAVIILGHGGAGKSTTGLLSLEAGLRYIADDRCIVSHDGAPVVHSLFATGKVAFDELHRFPLLAPSADTTGRPADEKAILFLDRLRHAQLVPQLPLRALLLARITGQPATRLRPVGRAAAFKAIVASSVLHFPQERPCALECFNSLARHVPAYIIELGSDMRSTPLAIQELLDNPPA